MEPVSLVLAALAAGASAGLSGTATQAVTDTYAALKSAVAGRLARRGRTPAVLDADQVGPDEWQARLADTLSADDIDDDVVVLTERLLGAVDQAGKYHIDLRDARGVQVGDGSHVQNNTFN